MSEHEERNELRAGFVVLAVGIWLLINTMALGGLNFGESWPLLLILIGLAITFTPEGGRRLCCEPPGPVLVVIGTLAWIAIHRSWGLSWETIWPLVVVAVGLSIVWRAISDQLWRSASGEETEDADGST